jgi:hypothetical protein
MPSEFEQGLMIGLLIGEGHFGGDGRQPQVTLRMHVRHEALVQWLDRAFPGGRVYGPYHHDGRHYLQWMARGAYLRDHLVPFLEQCLSPLLDQHSWSRFDEMRQRYVEQLGVVPAGVDRMSSPALMTEKSEADIEYAVSERSVSERSVSERRVSERRVSERVEEVFERLRKAQADDPRGSNSHGGFSET